MPERVLHRLLGLRNHHQMHMIRHQAVSKNTKLIQKRVLTKQLQINPPKGVRDKYFLALHSRAALRGAAVPPPPLDASSAC